MSPTVLVKVHRDSTQFNDLVKNAMTDRLETLPPNANINDLLGVFDRGRVAIVMDGDKFLGLITRTDLLSYLRLQHAESGGAGEPRIFLRTNLEPRKPGN